MEILRVQPYGNVAVNFTVPEAFTESSDFIVRITDMADLSFSEQTYSATGEDGRRRCG